MRRVFVTAIIGRAGLGNELFPFQRALERAALGGYQFVAPSWLHLHLGPLLRRERDLRWYWRLFAYSSSWAGARVILLRCLSLLSFRRLTLLSEVGMKDYFACFRLPGEWHREQLIKFANRRAISAAKDDEYFSAHVRLGDYPKTLANAHDGLTDKIARTPMEWYAEMIELVRVRFPDIPVIVSSDGSDKELEMLLRIPGVGRSQARSALDEMLLLSHSCGIMGSCSTFSAWGAFLGSVPLLLMKGGNAYHPHSQVWECSSSSDALAWLQTVESNGL